MFIFAFTIIIIMICALLWLGTRKRTTQAWCPQGTQCRDTGRSSHRKARQWKPLGSRPGKQRIDFFGGPRQHAKLIFEDIIDIECRIATTTHHHLSYSSLCSLLSFNLFYFSIVDPVQLYTLLLIFKLSLPLSLYETPTQDSFSYNSYHHQFACTQTCIIQWFNADSVHMRDQPWPSLDM